MKGRRATGCTDFERGRRWLRREVLRVGVADLYLRTSPHTPGDMAATIFHTLGLNPHEHLHDRLGRPFPLADGEPMEGVFA